MRYKRAAQTAAALVAIALVVPACSSDRTETAVGADSGSSTSSSSESASTASSQKFGTLDSPCGKGDAKGATDQGVTDKSITIGYGDDRGATASPGLSKEMGDAVKAMIAWCNEQGGINGREIKGNQYDAAITKVNSVMQDSCKSDFMLVGQGFAGDAGGEATRVACNLVTVPGYVTSADALNAPMMYEAFPTPADYFNNSQFHHLATLSPDAKTGTEVISTTLPAVTSTNLKAVEGAKEAGFTLKNCGITTNFSGEPNFVPFAEKYKSCGMTSAFYTGSGTPAIFNLLQAINQVGTQPTYVLGTPFYADSVAQWNAATKIPNMHVDIAFQPFENASKVPAVQKYLDIVTPTGGKTALLGMQATSSFLLWATAAKECGSDLTRQCMVNELSKVHQWTGGGMHATTDPGANKPANCSMTLKLEDGKFNQVLPKTQGEFDCDGKYLVKVSESAWGTQLNEDRIVTKYLTPNTIKPQS
ncbi:ABC transporter substrate-binding protein [Rhodococcus sp. X156]|uniref:ABC transporter substrate-binding protein n=1 Tax=Rhodococcus sp. X156 TaxID=2499145 RepID=UPI000FDB3962|nr:ABC transporter substrate-binding protein [Rhodococcus sp. X156]